MERRIGNHHIDAPLNRGEQITAHDPALQAVAGQAIRAGRHGAGTDIHALYLPALTSQPNADHTRAAAHINHLPWLTQRVRLHGRQQERTALVQTAMAEHPRVTDGFLIRHLQHGTPGFQGLLLPRLQ